MDFNTLANIGRIQADAETEQNLATARGAVAANTMVDKSYYQDAVENMLVGPAMQTAAFVADKTGFENTADDMMANLVRRVGLNLKGEADTEKGTASELFKYVGPSVGGSAAWALGKGAVNDAIKSKARQEVSRLVKKPSIGAKAGDLLGEVATQNVFISMGDATRAAVVDGKVDAKTGTAEDYFKIYIANLSGDAMISAASVSAGIGIAKSMGKYKYKKSFKGKDYAETAVDADANTAINKNLLDMTNNGKIEPIYKVEEAENIGGSFNDAVASGNFEGLISDGNGNYARKRSDGKVEIQQETISEATGNKIVKFAEDDVVSRNGYISLDTFNHITGKAYKTLEEIDVDTPFAVYDNVGNVRTKTEVLGDIKGKLLDNNDVIVDLKRSSMTNDAYSMTYNGKHMFRGISTEAAVVKQAFGSMSDTEIRNFTDYHFEIGTDGKVKVSKEMAKSADRRFGDLTEYIDNDPVLNLLNHANIKTYSGDAAVGTKSIIRRATPFKQYLTAETVAKRVGGGLTDLENFRNLVNNRFDNTFSAILERKLSEFESLNPDKAQNKPYFDLMNFRETTNGVAFSGLKPEFKKALDTAYAMELAKIADDNGMVEPKKLQTGILNTAFDLLGAEPKSSYVESVKKNFADLLGEDSFNHTLTEGSPIKAIDENGNTTTMKQVDSEIQNEFNQLLGDTPQDRSRAINNMLDHGYSKEKYGYVLTGDDGIVRNKFAIPEEMDPLNKLMSDKMRKTAYYISDENRALADTYIALAKSKTGKGLALSASDVEIAIMLGDLKPGQNYKVMNPRAKEAIKANIDSFRRKMIQIQDILDNMDPEIGVKFDVEMDINSRSRYMGEVNPDDKLFMTLFHNKDQLFEIKNAKDAEFIKRSALIAVGEKVEGTHNTADINAKFEVLAKTVLTKDGNVKAKFKYSQNNKRPFTQLYKELEAAGLDFEPKITHGVLNSISNAYKALNGTHKGEFVMFSEGDAKLSGVALTLAQLGYKDKRLGLGGKIDTAEADLYTVVAEKLGISRAEAKPAVIGNNYLASDKAAATAFGELIVKAIMKHEPVSSKVVRQLDFIMKLDGFQKGTKNVKRRLQLIEQLNEISEIKEANPDMTLKEIVELNEARYAVSNELKALIDIEKSGNKLLGQDVVHLANGILQLQEGKRLGDKSYDALVGFFSEISKVEIGTALKKLYTDSNFNDILKFREDIASFTNFAKEAFALKYNHIISSDNGKLKQKIVDIMKQLGREVDDNIVNDIFTAAKADAAKGQNGLSLRNIVNGIAVNGYLSDAIYAIKEMRDIIPMVSIGDGKMAPMITVKGYAGYQNSVNYKTATPIDVFAPIFTINFDALIMAHSLQKDMTNVMDAFVGAKSMDAALRTANSYVAAIGKDINPYSIMKESMNAILDDVTNYQAAHNNAKYWLTQQQLSKAGKHANPESIVKAMDNKRLSILDQGYNGKVENFMHNLDSTEKIVAERKATNYTPDTVIDNYSIGMDSSAITVAEAAKINTETVRSYKKFDTGKSYTYTLENMKNIESTDARPPVRLYDYHATSTNGAIDTTFEVKPGEKAKAYISKAANNNVTAHIIIGNEKPSPSALREAVHEYTHVVVDNNSHYIADVQQHIIDLVKDGRLTKEDGTAVWGELNPEIINAGEPISNIFHDLYTNELLMNNYKELGKAFGEKNLYKDVRPYIVDGGKIYTVKDLQGYLKGTNNAKYASQLGSIARTLNASMHANPDFISWMSGLQRDKFSSVVDESRSIYKLRKAAIQKVNNKIGQIGMADLFTLDASKDAIELAASIKTGADMEMSSMVAELSKALDKKLSDIAEPEAFSTAVGKMVINGVGEFMTEFRAAVDSKHFADMVANKMVKMRHEVMQTIGKNKKLVTKLDKSIASVANGTSKASPQKIADNILKEQYPTNTAMVMQKRKGMRDYIIKAAAAERIKERAKTGSLGNMFAKVVDPDTKKLADELITMLYTDFTNDKTMFNANVHYDLKASNRRLYIVPKDKYKGKSKYILARQKFPDGTEYYAVAKKDKSFIVGKQESQLMEFDLDAASYGIYEKRVGESGKFVINPQNLNTKAEPVDLSVTTMIVKNAYTKMYKDIGADAAFKQYQALKDSGVIISEADYLKMDKDARADFVKPGKTPFDKMFTGHYFNKKWEHYLAGSKGMDLGAKKMSKAFGHQLGPFISSMLKLVIGAAKALKGPLLVYRPSSYINNTVSNMMIYAINGSDAEMMVSPTTRFEEAKTKYHEYKQLLGDAMDINKTPEERARVKAKLDKHELAYAFKHGIANTIRTDAYTLGTAQENVLISNLKNITGDDRAANAFKTLLADPSTKMGAEVGKLFDATEMYPKLMMYLSLVENGNTPKEAIQKILLAFPTYNNVGPLLNGIDQISPYTKYMANFPKMFAYAMTQNPKKMLAFNAMFLAGVRASYGAEIDEDEQFWYDENYVKVFGLGYKAYESAEPYWIPSKTIDGFSVIDWDFVPSAFDSLTTPSKYIPLTIPDK